MFVVRGLTRRRIWFAFGVAVVTDTIQIGLGPAGGIVINQVLDVLAMVLISRAVGFHPLLLPTFVIEFFPIVDMLPTWTGCTAAVVMLRREAEPVRTSPTIDVASEVTKVPPRQVP
jgi:hypothetical protein